MKLPKIEPENMILFVVNFYISMSMSLNAPLIAQIRDHYTLTYTTTGIVLSTFGLSRLLLSLPSGYLFNHVRQKMLILSGISSMIIGAFIAYFSESFFMFLISQVLMGAAFSITVTTIVISLSIGSDKTNRGSRLGMNAFSWSSAALIVPGIAGYISHVYSWKTVYVAYASFGVIFFLIILFKMQNKKIEVFKKEAELTKPVNHKSMIITVLCVMFIGTFITSGFRSTAIPLFSTDNLSMNSATIGLMLSLTSLVFFISGPLSAHLSDRYGRKLFITTGLAAIIIGLGVFFFASSKIHVMIVLLCLGYGIIINIVSTALLGDMISSHNAGKNYGLMRFISDFGFFIGPIASGFIIDLYGFSIYTSVLLSVVIIVFILVQMLIHDEKFRINWKKIIFLNLYK